LRFELARNLLDIERRYRTMASRRGLFKALESAIERCFYDDADDAMQRAKARHAIQTAAHGEDEPQEHGDVQLAVLRAEA